jgi:hypothetical protein
MGLTGAVGVVGQQLLALRRGSVAHHVMAVEGVVLRGMVIKRREHPVQAEAGEQTPKHQPPTGAKGH